MNWIMPILLVVGLLTGCETTGRSVSSSASEEAASAAIILSIDEEVEEETVFEPVVVEEAQVDPSLAELPDQEVESKEEVPLEQTEPLLENVASQMPKSAMAQPSVPTPRASVAAELQQATSAEPVQPKVLRDVYFALDQATILDVAKPILEDNAELLKTRYKNRNVLIEGHCDERGSVEYNIVLGVRRAQVVKTYLVDLGIPPSRIRIVSYGKERPVCSQQNHVCWKKNRRTHFHIQ